MRTLIRLFKWLWRAWPVLFLLVLIWFHLLLIYYFYPNASTINKTTSLILQIVGGLLILYTVDSNIGIINKKSLFAIFANYLREFPLIRRSAVIESQGISTSSSVGKAKLTVGRNPQSLEEKIEYLQEQINEVKRDIEQESRDLNEKIEHQSKEMNIKIQETKSALQNIESKIVEVSIGGIKVQFFGVLLVVYGSISGYVA
ncbi:MAG: hypothetical protein AABY62_10680 [Pseudomonadota bacterium]